LPHSFCVARGALDDTGIVRVRCADARQRIASYCRLNAFGTPHARSVFSAGASRGIRLHADNRSSTAKGKSIMSFVDLVGKSVVVTGGARGIGRAIAHEFANAGADVVIGDFRFDEATKTALELSEVS